MAQNIIVNSDYNINVGANDVNVTAENFRVYGDLVVTGDQVVTSETNLSISNNTILINEGETGAGVTLGSAGITVDRGSVDDAILTWDETTDKWKFLVGASRANLEANVSMASLDLGGITITDIVTEAETIGANDNDTSIPTTAAVKDYADAIATSAAAGGAQYDIQYNTGSGLGGNSNFTVNYTTNVVSILGELNVDNININGNDIISSNVGGNITLTPNGVGNIILAKTTGVSVQLDFTDQGSDPSATASVNKIYSKTPSGGGTGLYFVNNTTTGEFISKSKSIAYSLVFGG